MGGQAQQRMGQVGVGEARGQGRVVEADCCWHWYVRPLDTGEVLATSPRGSDLRCLLNVLFQLLHVPLKLGSSVLEPANNLKINFVEIFLLWRSSQSSSQCSISAGIAIDVIKTNCL